ncbi:unnamed protein product [Cuscuta campestris]|uniref:Cytochrome c oxidase copper chaperone n=1 Tax=Cuscuta campestris TaxID=132261 RepID=A0A484NMJ2_9ASTE|nr:unnamed protein product [Cuscuta campestris]
MKESKGCWTVAAKFNKRSLRIFTQSVQHATDKGLTFLAKRQGSKRMEQATKRQKQSPRTTQERDLTWGQLAGDPRLWPGHGHVSRKWRNAIPPGNVSFRPTRRWNITAANPDGSVSLLDIGSPAITFPATGGEGREAEPACTQRAQSNRLEPAKSRVSHREEEAESQPREPVRSRLANPRDRVQRMEAKLERLERRVEDKNDNEKPLADSPFTAKVHLTPFPRKVNVEAQRFTGKEDLEIHLHSFNQSATMMGCTDEEKYLLFFQTLQGRATELFNKLRPGSIDSGVVRQMIESGELGKEYLQKAQEKNHPWVRPEAQKEDRNGNRRGNDRNKERRPAPDKEHIGMIFGGLEGGDSAAERNNWVRSIYVGECLLHHTRSRKFGDPFVRQEIHLGSGLLSRERERSVDLVRQRVPSLGICLVRPSISSCGSPRPVAGKDLASGFLLRRQLTRGAEAGDEAYCSNRIGKRVPTAENAAGRETPPPLPPDAAAPSRLFFTMAGLPIESTPSSSCAIGIKQSPKDQSAATAVVSDSKPKKKICCACPETKKLRDECIVEHGESACQKWIEAHRICLRAEGFNV